LILANFNPNSRLNDYNPDRHIYQYVDKAQLTKYSTEFCFEPTGIFDIGSLGVVLDSTLDVTASYEINCSVELWKIYRDSTQAQFMRGLEVDSATGNSNLAEYFTENTLDFFASAGAALDGNRGYTIQSYPEPIVHENSVYLPPGLTDLNYIDDSFYDGFLSLASYKIQQDDCHEDPRFIVNFDGTLAPALQGVRTSNMANDGTGIDDDYLATTDYPMAINYTGTISFEDQPQNENNTGFMNPEPSFRREHRLEANQPTALPLTNAKPNANLIGNLHPDGALSDAGRILSYPMSNIGRNYGMMGTLEFWIKPNYDAATATRIRTLYTFTPATISLYFVASANTIPLTASSPIGMWYFPRKGSNEYNCNWEAPGSYGATSPTHSIVTGWWSWQLYEPMICNSKYARVSETANHSWPGHDNAVNHGCIGNLFNFETREWTHIISSWDVWGNYATSAEPYKCLQVIINNQAIRDDHAWYHNAVGDIFPIPYAHDFWRSHAATSLPPYFIDPAVPDWDQPGGMTEILFPVNYIRFGEFSGIHENVPMNIERTNPGSMWAARKSTYRNWSADSTYADIIGYADGPFDYNEFGAPTNFSTNYRFGRYCHHIDDNNTAGRFTSHPLNIVKHLANFANTQRLKLRSVSWTLYRPRHNRNFDDANDRSAATMSGLQGLSNTEDLISVDIAHNLNGTDTDNWLFQEDKSLMPNRAGGTFLQNNADLIGYDYHNNDQFRYRIYFNLIDDTQVLYQSPVLDDITFTFLLSKPNILKWHITK
ncbi:hypothetical protein ACFL54_04520, partial [Planctomycetota bacterium]